MAVEKQPQAQIQREYPQSFEAEQATLGAMLLEGRVVVDIASMLTPDHFSNDAHRRIYEAILMVNERNLAVDLTTVTEYLRGKNELEKVGGAEYLMTLVERVSTTANARHYAQIVVDRGTARKLIQTAQQIADLGYHGEMPVEDMLNQAEEMIFQLSEKRLRGDFEPLKKLVKETYDHIDKRYQEKGITSGLGTGFVDFDALTSGLQPADLIIIAGRPSMGKTSLAMNIAQHVVLDEKPQPVGMFSLEMSSGQLVEQLICGLARVDAHKLRLGLLNKQDWQRIMGAVNKLHAAPLFIDDTPGISVMEMRAKARRLKARHGLGLLVIDYVQLIATPFTRSDNRAQEIAFIARQLKQMARELECPVIAISQLSRAVERRENKRPMLSDLMESSALEAEADMVCFVYRPKYYEQRSDEEAEKARQEEARYANMSLEERAKAKVEGKEQKPDVAELIIAKHRTGPTGTVNLVFIPKYRLFTNYTKREEPVGT